MKSKSPLDASTLLRRGSITPSSRKFQYKALANNPIKPTLIPPKSNFLFRRDISCNNKLSAPTARPRPVAENSKTNSCLPGGDSLFSGNIEDYKLGKVLGQGAYAVVKLSVHRHSTQRFAVKSYDKSRLVDPQKKRNLVREIRIMKQLQHSNIVEIREAIDSTRQIHLVMEYIEGRSLQSYLRQKPNRQLPELEAKGVFSQLVSALHYLHTKQVTHRDIKLDNILLGKQLRVKLIDFGFSTCFTNNKAAKIFCGTPSYMAPEIVARKECLGPPLDI